MDCFHSNFIRQKHSRLEKTFQRWIKAAEFDPKWYLQVWTIRFQSADCRLADLQTQNAFYQKIHRVHFNLIHNKKKSVLEISWLSHRFLVSFFSINQKSESCQCKCHVLSWPWPVWPAMTMSCHVFFFLFVPRQGQGCLSVCCKGQKAKRQKAKTKDEDKKSSPLFPLDRSRLPYHYYFI